MGNVNIANIQSSKITSFFAITAFCLGLSMPTSTFLLNVSLALCLICVLLKINPTVFKYTLKNLLVVMPAFMFIAYLLSAFIVQNDYGWGITIKYRKLLYPVILVPFFLHDKSQIDYFFKGFLFANLFIATLNAVSYTFTHITGMPFPVPMNFFKEYLTISFFMAIAAFICLIKANGQLETKSKYRYLLISLLLCFNILFILPGRTGVLALLTALFLYLVLNADMKYIAIALAFIALSAFAMLTTQNRIITRTVEGISEIRQYMESVEPSNDFAVAKNLDHTSMGFRIAAAHKALDMIKKAPILGHGAGSYLYKQNNRNPHNEYLLVTVQFGIAGLFAFLFWLYKACIIAWQQVQLWRNIFFVIISTFITGCFFNSFLLDFSEGIFFMSSISALAAMHIQGKNLNLLSEEK